MSATNGILPPHPADWLKEDPSLSVCPPMMNNANSRGAEALEAIIDQFDVEHAARYRPRDVTGDGKKETWCNLYVSDVTAALCAPIPHWLGGKWQLVADNLRWLRAGYNGWRPCSDDEAQVAANNGFPAVVVWVPPVGHGHIALLVPRPAEHARGVWITQAGARCYRRAPLMAGFGNHTTELHWYQHD